MNPPPGISSILPVSEFGHAMSVSLSFRRRATRHPHAVRYAVGINGMQATSTPLSPFRQRVSGAHRSGWSGCPGDQGIQLSKLRSRLKRIVKPRH